MRIPMNDDQKKPSHDLLLEFLTRIMAVQLDPSAERPSPEQVARDTLSAHDLVSTSRGDRILRTHPDDATRMRVERYYDDPSSDDFSDDPCLGYVCEKVSIMPYEYPYDGFMLCTVKIDGISLSLYDTRKDAAAFASIIALSIYELILHAPRG